MKKYVSTSSALIIGGVSLLSFAFTASAESTEGSGSTTSSSTVQQDSYDNCISRAKLQGLTGDDCTERAKMMDNIQNRPAMGTGTRTPPLAVVELKSLLKDSLTDAEKETFNALLKSQQAERETVMKDSTLTPEEWAAKMKELITSHVNTLLTYISTDKQDTFKKMMENSMNMMLNNQNIRRKFKEGEKNNTGGTQTKKQALSEKNRTQLEKIINTLSAEKLQTILDKVTKAISTTKRERVLAQLAEIEELLQNKIDELTGTSSGDSVISDILDSTTTQ